jgi:hypothetical protein
MSVRPGRRRRSTRAVSAINFDIRSWLAAIVLTVASAQVNVALASDTDALSPVQIFWRAQAAINRLPQPAYIAFTFENQGYNSTNDRQSIVPTRELLRVLVRASDGSAVITALKNQGGQDVAHPGAFVVTTTNDYFAVSNVLRLGDFPLADFGLRYGTPSRPGFFEPLRPPPSASPLLTIATVFAFKAPPYQITKLGDTVIEGRPVYHLALAPIRDPARNVLRQMWIDKETFLPARYVAFRTVIDPFEYFSYLVTVDAVEIDGRIVNVSAAGNSKNGLGKWLISDVSFPALEPDWVFDRAQWRSHNGEQIPNLAPNERAPNASATSPPSRRIISATLGHTISL